MLREDQYILRRVSLVLDALCVLAALAGAYLLRAAAAGVLPHSMLAPMRLRAHLWLLVAGPLVTLALLAWNGLYDTVRLHAAARDVARRLALACFEMPIVLMAIVLLLGKSARARTFLLSDELAAAIGETSTAFLFLAAVVLYGLLRVKASGLGEWLLARRRRGVGLRRVLLVGLGAPLREFLNLARANPVWGLEIVGVIGDGGEVGNEKIEVLGGIHDASEILTRVGVDEVVLVPDVVPFAALRGVLDACAEMGLRTHVPLNFYGGPIAHPVVDRFGSLDVLSYAATRDIGAALVVKYAFDRVAAPLLLILASPVMLAAALAVRFSSGAGEPVFFSQRRCGLNGRVFTCWKFRSMVVGAEAKRGELETKNEQAGPVFKMAADPRVTRVGRWLRKFSIDELPQLWNVARGEMSLVGPRPALPEEVAKYDRWQRRRLSMKPGITCLWQVSGRNRVGFDEWMKLDLEYIDGWSLWLDARILARTVWVVLRGDGAM